eukprot:1878270-Pyramimonas_sp.AAC.1
MNAAPGVRSLVYATADATDATQSRYAKEAYISSMTDQEAAEIRCAIRDELPHFFDAVEMVEPEYVMARWVRKYRCGIPFE